MCAIDLDPCEVWRPEERKARKAHVCGCCGGLIRVGERYVSLFTVFDGEASNEASCLACWADNKEFGKTHSMCSPSYLREMVDECVGDYRDRSQSEWAPLLARLDARRDAARGAR